MPISHVVSCNNMIRKLWNVEAKYVLSMLPHFPALSMHSEWRKKKGQTHWYLYLAIISFFRLVSVNWEPFLLGSSLYAILKCDEVCYKKTAYTNERLPNFPKRTKPATDCQPRSTKAVVLLVYAIMQQPSVDNLIYAGSTTILDAGKSMHILNVIIYHRMLANQNFRIMLEHNTLNTNAN